MRTEHLLRIAAITFAITGTLIMLLVLWELRTPMVLCFLSFGVAAALQPLIDRLVGRRLPQWLALAVVYVCVGAAIIVTPLALAQPLATEASSLADDFSAAAQPDSARQPTGRLQHWLAAGLPRFKDLAIGSLDDGESAASWQLLGVTWGAFELLGNVVVIFVLSIYWSADHERFERLWLSLLSARNRAPAREIWQTVQTEVGGYLRSEAVQCLAAGLLLGLGYYLLGFPYPVLLASIVALAWLVPWGGVVIAAMATLLLSIPAVVTVGDHVLWMQTLPAVACTIVVFAVLEYVVEPRFFDRRRYNSLLVLLLVIVFAELFGIAGLLLAPPVAATLQCIGGYLLRLRSAVNTSTVERNELDDRVEQLWHLAQNTENAAPELVNILERLTGLANEVRQIAAPGSGRSAVAGPAR